MLILRERARWGDGETSRRAAKAEAGFTLLEMVVALTVLAIGVFGVTNVFASSLRVVGKGTARTRAVALATGEADRLRAVPYARLGFTSTQPGFLADFEGLATVQVAAPLADPQGPDQTMGGTTYSVRRHIVWADAASATSTGTTYAQAYKRITVVVSWADQGGRHDVRQDSIVYPGGQGAYVGPQGVTTTTLASSVAPASPSSLVATVPAAPAGASTVSLSWTPAPSADPPVDTWVVQYSTDGFATAHQLTDSQPASSPSFDATGLSASTTYQFRVAARTASGALSAWSVPASATTLGSGATACQVGTATITPSSLKRRSAASLVLAGDAGLSVNTTGSCTTLRASYTPTAGFPTTVWLTPVTGGAWAGTVDGDSTNWDIGVHPLTILDQAGNRLGTLTLTVCAHNARSCP